MGDPVYILIRTSHRPKFFANMMASVKMQTYPNITTIVHSDDPEDAYVYGDIVLHGKHLGKEYGTFPANLYCNTLLDALPSDDGWHHYMDDDDVYMEPETVAKMVSLASPDCVNFMKNIRPSGVVPKAWGSVRYTNGESMFLHNRHRKLARWSGCRGGDNRYCSLLTDKLPIHWVDLVITRMQQSKGYGRQRDMVEVPE